MRKPTELTAISDEGQVVGYDLNNSSYTGFLYNERTQSFTALVPPKGFYVLPFAINNGGDIGGLLLRDRGQTGFVLVGSHYSQISPPETHFGSVFGVTAKGMVFGSATNKEEKGLYFSYSQGKYSDFSIPNVPNNAITGVNPQGTEFVGYYYSSSGVASGFTYQNGVLATLQFPGSNGTYAIGINRAGEVVGYFYDSQSNI